MKKNILILLLTSFIIFVVFLSAPVQDRTSSEFHSWHKEHEEEIARGKLHQKIILDREFHFNNLEIIIVSPGEKYYSWWGHVLLRFQGSGNKSPDEDLAIGFVADFNDFPLNKIKAGFGGYETFIKADKLSHFKRDYVEKEHRMMAHFTLITNSEQNLKLLNTIRDWIKNPMRPGSYSFFFKNCVTFVNELLFEAHILKEKGFYGYFPKYVIEHYRSLGIIKDGKSIRNF